MGQKKEKRKIKNRLSSSEVYNQASFSFSCDSKKLSKPDCWSQETDIYGIGTCLTAGAHASSGSSSLSLVR